jgi:hypothetical protein
MINELVYKHYIGECDTEYYCYMCELEDNI